jgi:hypothetical protein
MEPLGASTGVDGAMPILYRNGELNLKFLNEKNALKLRSYVRNPMKVIKSGKMHKPFQLTCNTCECVVETTKNELEFEGDWRDGNYYSFDCPECDNKQIYSASVITRLTSKVEG